MFWGLFSPSLMHEYDKENGVIQFTLYIHALHIIYKRKQWQAFQNINSVYDLVLSTHLVCAIQCAGILHISFVLIIFTDKVNWDHRQRSEYSDYEAQEKYHHREGHIKWILKVDGFHQVGKGSDQKHIPSRDNIISKCRDLENYPIPGM